MAEAVPIRSPLSTTQLLELLALHGIAYEHYEHPAVFTTAEASKLVPPMDGAKVKNLFLRDRSSDRLLLVMVPYEKRVDLAKLGAALNLRKLSFGSAEELLACLGVTAGAVSVLALINDTRQQAQLVVDEPLWGAQAYQCHPLVNTATLSIGREGLMRFLQVTGHTPRVLEVPARST